MKCRDLINFPFVDHFDEKDRLNNFLKFESNSVLYLQGEHGIGKTFLLQQIEHFCNDFKIVYLDCRSNIADAPEISKTCLYQFLSILQNNINITIKNFIANYYENLLNISKGIIIQVLKNKGIDLESLVEIAFDSTKTFLSNKNKEQSAQKVIINYIENIAQNKKILIIFDDFCFCDKRSISSLIEIMSRLYKNSNIKFIIASTYEDLKQSEHNIGLRLMNYLDVVVLKVEAFKYETFFYEILDNIFNLEEEDRVIVNELFTICKGNPCQLKKILCDLFYKEGIVFSENRKKAIWKREVIYKLLNDCPSNIKFSIFEKLILQTVVAFNQLLSYDMLYKAVFYLAEVLSFSNKYLENKIEESFEKLLEMELLQLNEKNKIIITQYNVMKKFQKEKNIDLSYPLVSYKIYDFLIKNKEDLLQNTMTLTEWNALLSFHSFRADILGWQHINYEYAKMLYNKKFFDDASKVLQRIPLNSEHYSLTDYTMMINCYFESGYYKEAEDIINIVSLCNNDISNEKISYHVVCSKVFNILLRKEEAILELEKVLPLIEENGDLYLEILNRKQEILVDTSNGKERAKQIFDHFITLYNNGYKHQIIGKALRNSIDFYHADEALHYLSIAENIFKNNNDALGLGYLYTNCGFEHYRQNNISLAKQCFQTSIDNLKDIRFYEISYPLSNMSWTMFICLTEM